MTAIVAVLNKHAVAVAADSAVTMGNTHKVVNSANKIFTLSKYNPVAVMTYNNAAFMGTPWDIIIKEYRKQLKDTSFQCLKEYLNDFIAYLHQRNFFCDEQTQKSYIIALLDSFYGICRQEIERNDCIKLKDKIDTDIERKLNEWMTFYKSLEKCDEFVSYPYEKFKDYAYNDILIYATNCEFSNINLLCESFYYYLTAKFPKSFYTGLVFVGYGESEIYPALYPINITLGIDGRLQYYIEDNRVAVISAHGAEAVIAPFAQIDVTQTIIRGIHPSFQDIISKVTEKSINSVIEKITKILDTTPENEALSTAVKSLDISSVLKATSLQIVKAMQTCYTDPLLNTVVSLDKEDMANMAESFISLTSLVRRMQPGEETVGGPVDVAVISKGDGFIWINRKHYFKPELNASFFSNYFK